MKNISEKADVVSRVQGKIYSRVRVLNPWKLDNRRHLYNYALSSQEWAAIQFLERNPSCINLFRQQWETTVVFPPNHARARQMAFRLGGGKAALHLHVVFTKLPIETQRYIDAWMAREKDLLNQAADVDSHLQECIDKVGTWGQFHRLWPGVLGFLTGDVKSKVLAKKARSSLRSVLDENGNPPACFDADRCVKSEMLLSEAFMLPPWSPTMDVSDRPLIVWR